MSLSHHKNNLDEDYPEARFQIFQVQDSVQAIAGSFATLVSRLSPAMQEGGRIVAISGLDRIFAVSDHGLIGAGKAAVESMVRDLAMELGPRGITVNAVVPGACR